MNSIRIKREGCTLEENPCPAPSPWPAQGSLPMSWALREGLPSDPKAANSTQGSHAEKSPALRIIAACCDLHKPQIKMCLRLARGLSLLPLSLPKPAGFLGFFWKPTARRAGGEAFLFPLARVSWPRGTSRAGTAPQKGTASGFSEAHNAKIVPALLLSPEKGQPGMEGAQPEPN